MDSDAVDKFAIKEETGAILVGGHLSDTSGTFFIKIEAFDNEVGVLYIYLSYLIPQSVFNVVFEHKLLCYLW